MTFEFGALEYSDPESVRMHTASTTTTINGSRRRHHAAWPLTPTCARAATVCTSARAIQGEDWAESAARRSNSRSAATLASPLAYAIYAAALVLAAVLILRFSRGPAPASAVQEAMRHGAERLKLALWGSGSELWDVDLRTEEWCARTASNISRRTPRRPTRPCGLHAVHASGRSSSRSKIALRAHLSGKTPTFECSYRTLDIRAQVGVDPDPRSRAAQRRRHGPSASAARPRHQSPESRRGSVTHVERTTRNARRATHGGLARGQSEIARNAGHPDHGATAADRDRKAGLARWHGCGHRARDQHAARDQRHRGLASAGRGAPAVAPADRGTS